MVVTQSQIKLFEFTVGVSSVQVNTCIVWYEVQRLVKYRQCFLETSFLE